MSAAAESTTADPALEPIVIHLEDVAAQDIQPRLSYLATAFTNMQIVDGKAECQAIME